MEKQSAPSSGDALINLNIGLPTSSHQLPGSAAQVSSSQELTLVELSRHFTSQHTLSTTLPCSVIIGRGTPAPKEEEQTPDK